MIRHQTGATANADGVQPLLYVLQRSSFNLKLKKYCHYTDKGKNVCHHCIIYVFCRQTITGPLLQTPSIVVASIPSYLVHRKEVSHITCGWNYYLWLQSPVTTSLGYTERRYTRWSVNETITSENGYPLEKKPAGFKAIIRMTSLLQNIQHSV